MVSDSRGEVLLGPAGRLLRVGTTPGRVSRSGARSEPIIGARGPRSHRATRDSESFLGPLEDRGGEPPACGPLQQAAWSALARIYGTRGSRCRSSRTRDRHRGTAARDFQPSGHARPVDLGQDVVGKVRILIQAERPRRRVAPRRERARSPRARCSPSTSRPSRSTNAHRPTDLRARERPEPALMRPGQAGLAGPSEELA